MTRSARILCTLATAALLCSSAAAQWSGPNVILPQWAHQWVGQGTGDDTVAMGDVTGNALADIIIGRAGTQYPRYKVIANLGPGNGTANTGFALSAEWGTGDGEVSDVVTADINGDQVLDFVSAQTWFSLGSINNTSRVKWFENQGSGTGFTEHILSPILAGVGKIKVADLNGDGWTDIVGADDDGLHVWINQGGGTFTYSPYYSNDVRRFELTDVDGDSDIDIVAAVEITPIGTINGNNSACSWRANDGNGLFGQAFGISGELGWVRGIESGDINGDGKMDLLAFDIGGYAPVPQGQNIWYCLNAGAGNGFNGGHFFPWAHLDSGFTFQPAGLSAIELVSLRVGDFDGDGDADAVIGNGRAMQWIHYETVGTGGALGGGLIDSTLVENWVTNQLSTPSNPVPVNPDQGIDALAVGDIDGNGTLDLLAAGDGGSYTPPGFPSANAHWIAWWGNNATLPFSVAITQPQGQGEDVTVDLADGLPSAPYFLVHSWDPANQSAWNQGLFLGLHISIPNLLNLLSLGVSGNVPWAGGALDANGAMSYTFVGSGASHVPSLVGMTVTAVAIQEEQIAPVQYGRTQLHSYTIQ